VGASFAAGADDKMYRTTGGGFEGDDTAGAEFDIVRVGAEGEEGRERGFSRRHDEKLSGFNRRSRCNAYAASTPRPRLIIKVSPNG
jgi:hypothetical protein